LTPKIFEELEKINERPEPFQFYTASDLWADEHTSKQMLSFHLNEDIDVSSRNAEFIEAGLFVKGLYSDVAGTPYDRRSNEFAVIANRT
jgi:hypothetical protein